MEDKRKEIRANVFGLCPKCGNPLKLEVDISTELVQPKEEPKTEVVENAGEETEQPTSAGPESANAGPDNSEGKSPKAGAGTKPADSAAAPKADSPGGGE